MNTRSLHCFIKVYEKKSISSAAKEVFISPQGLSKVIKQLEIDLEAELFYRGPHGMEATEAGELLYARAKHILYLMEDIKKEINVISGSRGALNVMVTYSAALAVPLDFLFNFSEIHPNIQIKLIEYPDEFPIGSLFQEEADIGLIMRNDRIRNCKYELLVSGEMVIIVSKNHHLAGIDKISITELASEPLILKSVEKGRENSFTEKCREYGFMPNVRHETGNMTTLHALCEQRNLIAVSTDFIESAISNENLKIIKLEQKIQQNIYLISHKREIENRAVSLLLQYIRDNIPCKL